LNSLFNKASTSLDYLKEINFTFDVPKQESHGDLSVNAAMLLTKKLRKNPRQIAEEIISNLQIDDAIISKVEIAGPGFINFFFTPSFVARIIKVVIAEDKYFGKSKKYEGKKANLFQQIPPDR